MEHGVPFAQWVVSGEENEIGAFSLVVTVCEMTHQYATDAALPQMYHVDFL